MAGHVSGRTSLSETGAVLDGESVATTIFSSQSKGKRDRDTNVVNSLKDRELSMENQLELRNRFFQEDHARDCQEIEELRRVCCEEADRARQARIDEIVYASREESYHCESIDGSDSGITEQSKFFVRCQRIFLILNPESGSGATHVPDQTSTVLSHRTLPRCDCGFPRDTQNGKGITRNVFERPSAQEGVSPTNFHNSKNLASSSHELRLNTTERARRESGNEKRIVNTSIQPPHFQSRSGMLNHTGGAYSHNGMMDYPRILVQNGIMEIFLTLSNFKAGESTSELRVVREQRILRSLCFGFKKLRLLNQLRNFRHRDQQRSDVIFLTAICLLQ